MLQMHASRKLKTVLRWYSSDVFDRFLVTYFDEELKNMVNPEAIIDPNYVETLIITLTAARILGAARSAPITNPRGAINAPAPMKALISDIDKI